MIRTYILNCLAWEMFFQCVSSNFSVVDKNIYVSLKNDISKIKENVTIAMDYIDFQRHAGLIK